MVLRLVATDADLTNFSLESCLKGKSANPCRSSGDRRTGICILYVMVAQASGPEIQPLSCNEDQESDVNEVYYSLEEQDQESDISASYYSVEDEEIIYKDSLVMNGCEDVVDERSSERSIIEDEAPTKVGGEDYASESRDTMEETELYDFFSNGHHSLEVKGSFVAKQDFTEVKRRDFKPAKLYSPIMVEDSLVSDEITMEKPLPRDRSPSLMVTASKIRGQSVEINSIMEDIEVIELNDNEVSDHSNDLRKESNEIEVIGLDGPFEREEPFVEFDGTKKVIVIVSDDDSDDDETRLGGSADRTRKRDRSFDPYEPTTDELQQSPVQRKMKKLMQLAQKADNNSCSGG